MLNTFILIYLADKSIFFGSQKEYINVEDMFVCCRVFLVS